MGCGGSSQAATPVPAPAAPPRAAGGRRYSTKTGVEAVHIAHVQAAPKSKKDAEATQKLLEKELAEVDETMAETMKQLMSHGAHEEESHDEHDDDEDPTKVPTSKLEAWEARKLKYRKYADKGKVEKLERARDKQVAKAKKAEETKKDKPYYEAYVKYK